MNRNRYLMSFTTGGLFYSESLLLLDLYWETEDWDKVHREALDVNILQARVVSTNRRVLREVIGRLRMLTKDALKLLQYGSPNEQRYLLWLGICRRYEFIYDFALEVIRERYLTLKLDLPVEEFESFYNAKEQWHAKLETIAPSTRTKLRTVLFRMLREAEIIDANKFILPAMLTDELIGIIAKHDVDDLVIFPISDIDLQRVI